VTDIRARLLGVSVAHQTVARTVVVDLRARTLRHRMYTHQYTRAYVTRSRRRPAHVARRLKRDRTALAVAGAVDIDVARLPGIGVVTYLCVGVVDVGRTVVVDAVAVLGRVAHVHTRAT
jgi:hypothetical protein